MTSSLNLTQYTRICYFLSLLLMLGRLCPHRPSLYENYPPGLAIANNRHWVMYILAFFARNCHCICGCAYFPLSLFCFCCVCFQLVVTAELRLSLRLSPSLFFSLSLSSLVSGIVLVKDYPVFRTDGRVHGAQCVGVGWVFTAQRGLCCQQHPRRLRLPLRWSTSLQRERSAGVCVIVCIFMLLVTQHIRTINNVV